MLPSDFTRVSPRCRSVRRKNSFIALPSRLHRPRAGSPRFFGTGPCMRAFTRRRFLGMSASAAGAAALGTLPTTLSQALAIPAAGRSMAALRHVVVLMQENRSFDHYFGALAGVRGFDDASALTLANGA